MRLVLDTNVALSGLLWQGTPGKLIDACQAGQIEIACSAPLPAELHGVIKRDKFALHLLALAVWQGIPIVSASEAVKRIVA